jgi:hypothetical protein
MEMAENRIECRTGTFYVAVPIRDPITDDEAYSVVAMFKADQPEEFNQQLKEALIEAFGTERVLRELRLSQREFKDRFDDHWVAVDFCDLVVIIPADLIFTLHGTDMDIEEIRAVVRQALVKNAEKLLSYDEEDADEEEDEEVLEVG